MIQFPQKEPVAGLAVNIAVSTIESDVMSGLMPRFLKSAYRKEPISSFILTVGTVDAVIGGVDSRLSLLILGLGIVGVAIALRWWLTQRNKIELPTGAPIHYLPSRSSRPSLPMLSVSRKNPPHS
jgi:small-conductance mechanosensitive channel